MPRPYPPEFSVRAIALVRDVRQVTQTDDVLDIHIATLHNWLRQEYQDFIDHGNKPVLSS